ncbi:MAG: hypothetical protein M0Q15_07805 [Nevskia sp.]|nr:hypothetical protein [Nevskia sp.]
MALSVHHNCRIGIPGNFSQWTKIYLKKAMHFRNTNGRAAVFDIVPPALGSLAMSLRSSRWLVAACAAALFLAACATPESRIKKNPEGFAKLTPEQQELIKLGKVGIGFDETAVKLALGEPDRISERTDTTGKSTIWRYVEYENDTGAPLYRGFYHYYYAPFYPFYTDYGSRRERDHIRVVFTSGKVSAIEQELK